MARKLIEVKNLKVKFQVPSGWANVVDGVNFFVNEGETLGLVGESGCGKSVTSLSIIGLIPTPPGRIDSQSSILFKGQNLLHLPEKEMLKIRGNSISMIFQEPMTSLNPVFTIGEQLTEVYRFHQGLKPKESKAKVIEMLELVGIPSPERRIKEYPHQLSGGMRQRIMIAMALACKPQLLIADEPTTALDVTIQAQILRLMRQLQEKMGTSTILITHDLGVVAETCHRVIVMYSGQIVEEAVVSDLFEKPVHPYTKGLLNSIPNLEGRRDRLHVIEGVVPNPSDLPKGCRFAPRCQYKSERCEHEVPQLVQIAEGHHVRCWQAAVRGDSNEQSTIN